MPSPCHPCAHPGCDKLVNPRATYCRSHFPRTREHIENQAAAQRGKRLGQSAKDKISVANKAVARRKGNRRYSKPCEQCGQSFQVKPSRVKDGEGRFCSSACAYAARSGDRSQFWKGGTETRECEQCGATIERTPAFFRDRKHVFCSLSCKAIWQRLHQPTHNTDIERLMRAALADAGLSFQEQVPLCNVTIADFYDPIRQIAIFCDGDYWHSLPKHIEQDKRQTTILENAGIVVLRFWGREIKSDIGACLNRIAAALALPPVQSQLPTFGE